MAPAEIALHVRRAAGYKSEALVWRLARPGWRRAWEPTLERIVSRQATPGSSLLLGASRVNAVREALVDAEETIVMEAERRLEGQVTVLGHPELRLGRERVFDCDPLSGIPWPDRHGRLIDYRLASPGDPKLVWELERCQELPLLALAALLTDDPRFADAAASRLHAWLAGHPPGRGIAWANAFEPAIRAVSLAVAFDALRGHSLMTGEAERGVVRGLWQHGRSIVRDLSRHSSANNHLVGELVGLLAVAVLVPELRDSSRWRDQAIEELSREAQLQVLHDGFPAEQSFAYGLFTTDLLLTCASLLETAGVVCPEPIVAALTRAADAVVLLVDVGEPEPAFGDADGGRVLTLDGARDRTARGVAASLAAFLGHSGAQRLAGSIDATAALLFGREGLVRFATATPTMAPGDGLFPDGGLVVLRREGTRALFDVGPLGYLSIAAHGHADALQVVVSHGGDELVSDPGTGSYLGDARLRRRLRGTAVHATVCVDGTDQSQQGGPFLWTRHAQARLLTYDLGAGVAAGKHDGYQALPDPVTHQRVVVMLDGGAIVVVDRLVGAGRHTYVQTWPLHPALEPRAPDGAEGVVVASSPDGPRLMLAFASPLPAKIVIRDDGRWSRRLEQSEAAWVVSQRVIASGPVELGALLVPLAADAPVPTAALELLREGDSCLARARIGDDVEELCLGFADGVLTAQRKS
ncbi:MAG: alginate lyase family protein [Actinomycetota bacterium]